MDRSVQKLSSLIVTVDRQMPTSENRLSQQLAEASRLLNRVTPSNPAMMPTTLNSGLWENRSKVTDDASSDRHVGCSFSD
jgi:hypothetical protein